MSKNSVFQWVVLGALFPLACPGSMSLTQIIRADILQLSDIGCLFLKSSLNS
jgi:hypothetical protein